LILVPLYKAAREGELDAIKIFIDKYTVENMDDTNVSAHLAPRLDLDDELIFKELGTNCNAQCRLVRSF
jgi:hypothetical protein